MMMLIAVVHRHPHLKLPLLAATVVLLAVGALLLLG
jgi:hypothetical protein